jgi:hypothetical protein
MRPFYVIAQERLKRRRRPRFWGGYQARILRGDRLGATPTVRKSRSRRRMDVTAAENTEVEAA